VDGWNNAILYGSDATGYGYTIRSRGKDGVVGSSSGETHEFNCDIVFQDGRYTAWPEGVQT
jgi:hypothetical protein